MDAYFRARESSLSAEMANSKVRVYCRKVKIFFKYQPEKFYGYSVCFVTFVVTLAIGILALISKSSLYMVLFGNYHRSVQAHSLVLVLILDFWIFCFNAALFFGLKFKNNVLIFLWILSMLIIWNVYVFGRLIHLVDRSQMEDVEVKELYQEIGHLFPVVGLWLLMISLIWDYWQTISNITDIPELIDFLIQRHNRSHEIPTTADGLSLGGGSEFTTSSRGSKLSKI